MSDIQLFRLAGHVATEIKGSSADLEKPLQTLIEANLETLLAIRFVATEHSTGRVHKGRIDTLGLDENNCPVILEYKRSSHDNVINQGLFYLSWLMDHRAEFELLVLKRFGKEAIDGIDWESPRLVCIAADFNRYDLHAVQEIDRNIELIRYRRFGDDLLLLELVHSIAADGDTVATLSTKRTTRAPAGKESGFDRPDLKPRPRWLPELLPPLDALFATLDAFILSLGDDVQRKDLKLYVGYRRLKNFATVVGQKKQLRLYLHLDPKELLIASAVADGEVRDVSQTGHWGTGDVEVVIDRISDLEKAKPFIKLAYLGGPLL